MSLRDFLFYEEPGITLYCGDANALLPMLWSCERWSVVTDPPYGELGYEWDKRPEWETLLLPEGLSRFIVFGHQPFLGDEIAPAIRKYGLRFLYEWIWEKPIGRLWNHRRPIRRHELIWHFGRSDAGIDLRNGFGDQHDSIISAMTFQAYMRAHPEATGHPTQKPLELMRAIIESMPENVILDPWAGSGTTLCAAKDLHRRAIGIEIEPRYCEIAVKRLRQEVLPL